MVYPHLRIAVISGAVALSLAPAKAEPEKFQHIVNMLVDCSLPDDGMAKQLSAAVNVASAYAVQKGLVGFEIRKSTPEDIQPGMIAQLREKRFLDISINANPDRPAGPRIVCKKPTGIRADAPTGANNG